MSRSAHSVHRAAIATRTTRCTRPISLVIALHLAFGGMLAAGTWPTAAHAQTSNAMRQYDIPAGSLGTVLTPFSAETGILLATPAELVQGKQSPGIKGSFSIDTALHALLTGTGLEAVQETQGQYRLQPLDRTTTLAPVTVRAQAASPSQLPEAYTGGQVARGGRVGMLGNKDVMDTPFSTTSYTNKTIEDQQSSRLEDLLVNDPSVLISTTSGENLVTGATKIRGFGDNTSISATGSLNGLAGMSASYNADMSYVERAEVLRGPSALLNGMAANGTGGVGGTTNLVTKQAGDEPLTQLTTRYTSRSQPGAHLDLGRRFGENKEFGIRFNGAFRKGDTPIEPQSARASAAALNLDYRGERVRLAADLVRQSTYASPMNAQMLNISAVRVVPKAPDAGTSLYPSWS